MCTDNGSAVCRMPFHPLTIMFGREEVLISMKSNLSLKKQIVLLVLYLRICLNQVHKHSLLSSLVFGSVTHFESVFTVFRATCWEDCPCSRALPCALSKSFLASVGLLIVYLFGANIALSCLAWLHESGAQMGLVSQVCSFS